MKTDLRRLLRILSRAAAAIGIALVVVGIRGHLWAEDAPVVESRLLESVKFLAADDLEGRGTGTKGLDKAAEYLAAEFAKIGLKSDVVDGAPFQKFEVVTDAKLGPPEKNKVTLIAPEANGESRRIEWKWGEDFNTLAIGGTHKTTAPIVFVGYGITAPEYKYDDYAGVDVKDKIVVIVRKEPQQGDEKSKFAGKGTTSHATFDAKVSNAYQHGAAAVIMVNDAYSLNDERLGREKQWDDALDKIEKERAEFRAKKDPTADDWKTYRESIIKLTERLTTLNQQLASDGDSVLPSKGAGFTTALRRMSVFFARRQAVDKMIEASLGTNLAAIEAKIDENLAPESKELAGWKADVESSVEHVRAPSRNVLAVLEGKGSLANETVIVGAHYDHLGMGGIAAGSLAPWTSAVHNGADDNASGTAAILEIARVLAKWPNENHRRIVFAAFSGEERGLLGSKYYVDNPAFPLESTVAMVNLDMVGRLSENKLIVYGTGTSSSFDGLIDGLNKKHAFDLKKDPAGEGPSDHQSFYQKQIPVFHFFTGTHSDYHRPSDDIEKINVAGMRRVTEMVEDLVEHLAGITERPNYVVVKSKAVIVSGGRPRPSFGSMPDYGATVEGCRLETVRPEGPAAKGGVKAGDIVVRLGENKIGSVEDFDSALRKFRPGDVVKVTVKRGEKPVDLEVTLGQPVQVP